MTNVSIATIQVCTIVFNIKVPHFDIREVGLSIRNRTHILKDLYFLFKINAVLLKNFIRLKIKSIFIN